MYAVLHITFFLCFEFGIETKEIASKINLIALYYANET